MELRFTRHALERLFQRKISPEDCETVFNEGTVVETYPDDKPFPSKLFAGKVRGRFIHVVVSHGNDDTFHVITAYEPDASLWNKGFKKRK